MADDITVYYKTGNKLTILASEYDPVNKEILNLDDPDFDGNYYADEITSKTVRASTSRIGLKNQYYINYLPAGLLQVNDVLINTKLVDVLIDPSNESGDTIFHRATKIVINGENFVPLISTFKYGLAGLLYSCALGARKDTNVT